MILDPQSQCKWDRTLRWFDVTISYLSATATLSLPPSASVFFSFLLNSSEKNDRFFIRFLELHQPGYIEDAWEGRVTESLNVKGCILGCKCDPLSSLPNSSPSKTESSSLKRSTNHVFFNTCSVYLC